MPRESEEAIYMYVIWLPLSKLVQDEYKMEISRGSIYAHPN